MNPGDACGTLKHPVFFRMDCMCPARSDLLDHVVKATRAYAQLANLLSEKVGVLSRDAYEEMWAGVEFARKIAEIARESLLAHEREHGCGAGNGAGQLSKAATERDLQF